mmetsp:Transcript_16029/g.43567  ORF Transcript_16029/g.43567 Transcript_16029/m.43567 type:complete len:217 (+) Transcript_16029:1424-2074(+)
MCEKENACPAECNLHGLCLDSQCVCAPGYEGRACERELPLPATRAAARISAARRCPNSCWGRGRCDGGRCECEPGWIGDDCSSVAPCLDDCSGHGLCARGTCDCYPGYEGANCSAAVECPGGCSGHGACVHGRCYCDPGFQADDCSVAPPPVSRAELEPPAVALTSGFVFLTAFAAGLALKARADQRRRARLIRYIQESDAQAPFVSGELRQALTS